ncbi:hypothetical protein [Streptosporangium sp. CA-115845]|uniref:hypothetical protein n=1 Tax=Streptosporangium sp. CA-115845 TaxID=3240071 RepID=UPI003D89DA12
MSPANVSREQYERWHIRTCARCNRRAPKSAEWSDGPKRCSRSRSGGPPPTCAIYSWTFERWLAERLGSITDAEQARIAACLVLLFAQPVSRIVRLTHDKSTTRIAAEAGGTWKKYAPGDHPR